MQNCGEGMAKQPLRFLPNALSGKWSIGLIVAMPLLFVIGISLADSLYKSVSAGDTILADISARPALALTMLTGMISGILSFVTGLVAIFRKKDRAILVYVSCTIGGLFVVFLVGDIVFPH